MRARAVRWIELVVIGVAVLSGFFWGTEQLANAQTLPLGTQIVCLVYHDLNSIGQPIPILTMPGCAIVVPPPGSGTSTSASITGQIIGVVNASSTLGGSVGTSTGLSGSVGTSTGLTGTVGTSSLVGVVGSGNLLSGTVTSTSTSGGGGGGGGGDGNGGGGVSDDNGPIVSGGGGGDGGGGPLATTEPGGEVLGASTSNPTLPGIPNTGAGGEAGQNGLMLLVSGMLALGSIFSLGYRVLGR